MKTILTSSMSWPQCLDGLWLPLYSGGWLGRLFGGGRNAGFPEQTIAAGEHRVEWLRHPPWFPAVYGLRPLHQSGESQTTVSIERVLSSVISSLPLRIALPPHPFRLWRQIPFVRVFVSNQPRFDLRLRAPGPTNRVEELR